jgi:DNA-binding NarL/FixJ family response regulator
LGAVAADGTTGHEELLSPAPEDPLSSSSLRGRIEDPAQSDLILIEDRSLIRECLVHSLKLLLSNRVAAFATIADWLGAADRYTPGAVLMSIREPSRIVDVQQALDTLAGASRPAPVIILCDGEDPWQIVDALERGARGYILSSISLEVAAQAVRLVIAGGVFAPAGSLIAAHPLLKRRGPTRSVSGLFTARQAAVVQALCRGKTNKDIAGELDLCESTVQVHVRNIMRKLHAKNRTEVAFIANRLGEGQGAQAPSALAAMPLPRGAAT